LLNTYPTTCTAVEYHLGDAYATSWGNSRSSFYGVGGTPTCWFDGVISRVGGSSGMHYNNEYNARRNVPTDVTIGLAGDEVSGQTYDITATVCIEAGGTAKTMRIYIAQVLDCYPTSPSYSRNTFKQAASTTDVTINPGECATIVKTLTFDATSWSNQANIKIIAWAQVPSGSSPAEVFQAASMGWPFPPAGAPNDDCVDAKELGNESFADTSELATNDGTASCGFSDTSPDVWFSYLAPADGTLEVDTCGSSFDTVLSVLDGCPGDGGVELVCNDDSDVCDGRSQQSFVSLSVTEGVVYLIRLAGNNGANGDYVINVNGPVDITPPTPDPMAFESVPAALSPTEIEMMAVQASDVGSPEIEYYFELVAGGAGGSDSGWQEERDYADSDLTPNTEYTYAVRARDGALNETVASPAESAVTLAATPGQVVIDNVAAMTMDLAVGTGTNPDYTEFAIQCVMTPDASWTGMYLGADGYPAGSGEEDAVWQSATDWGVTTARGLIPQTVYCWRAKARNLDLIETTFSSWNCRPTTASTPGDLDCDGDVDFDDINPFVLALGGQAGYEAVYPNCNWLNADVDGDGDVDFDDINPFVALLGG